MKKQLLITFILIIFGFTTYAQPGTIDLSFNSSDLGFGNGDSLKDLYYGNAVSVRTTAIQNDGKILIGGAFNFYNGQPRIGIARLNVDGSLDTSFNPILNNFVYTISIQNDGKIIIGGGFTTCNGITRNRIARINADGTLDNSFNPSPGFPLSSNNNGVVTTAIQSDGKIIVGGEFVSYNGISRNNIVRINIDGTIDASFNPGTGTDSLVQKIAIQNDGKIILGGGFSSFNNVSKLGLVRLNINGSLDTTFNSGSGLNGGVMSISIQNDGNIIIGGSFTTINGFNIKGLGRFNGNGTLDTFFGSTVLFVNTSFTYIQTDGKILVASSSTNGTNYLRRITSSGIIDNTFNASALSPSESQIKSLSIQNDGKLIIGATGGDAYSNSANIRFVPNPILRIYNNGVLDTSFNLGSGANYPIYTASIQNDGKIFIGGDFLKYNGTERIKTARLNQNGSLEITSNPIEEKEIGIKTSIIQTDGKILIGGGNRKLKRLNANDLSYDTQFSFSPTFIDALSVQNDGLILIGGGFINSTVFPRTCLGRVYSSDSFDSSFGNGFNGNNSITVKSITSQPDGKIIISGSFSSMFGTGSTRYITKLNSNGTIDTSFGTNICNSTIECHKVQNDGKIIIGGQFTDCNGTTRNRIARLNANGSLDTTFNPGTGANGIVRTISIQSDGKIIIGGDFTVYNGTTSNYIARLNIDGTLDNSFNIGTGANGIVRTTSIQSDGKIIIGGDFTAYNGIGRNRIARINGDNALSTNVFNKNTMVIYPNPSYGIFTLQTNEMNDVKSISIYTLLGQKIYDSIISSNETTIDITNQPKGVYLYKVLGEEGETKSGKLVIE